MVSIVSYRQVFDGVKTNYLALPNALQGAQSAQELATLPDGRTFVVIFDGYTLPANQPAAISASIETHNPLDAALREQIKAASPMVQLIYKRTEDKIREVYSASDEAKFARIGVGAALGVYTFGDGEQDELLAFGAHCEAARAWGRAERAKLGLA